MNVLDKDSDLYRIVGCAMNVYNELKSGYLESVYEAALMYELKDAGFYAENHVPISVYYRGIKLNKDFFADIVVNKEIAHKVILELKVVSSLRHEHEAQVRNYLKATGYKDALLINFGQFRRLEWKYITL